MKVLECLLILEMQGADRFLNPFETIKKELRPLTCELQRITDEHLYYL